MKRGFLNNTRTQVTARKPLAATKEEVKDNDKEAMRTDDAILPDLQIVALDTKYHDERLGQPICIARTSPLAATNTTIHPRALICTRAPPTSIDKFNRTSCILYYGSHVQLLQTPQYPSTPNHVDYTSPAPYVIREVKSKGKGMFATRTLKPGDLIAVERALVILPINTDLNGLTGCPQIMRDTMTRCQGTTATLIGVLEAMLEVALSRMSEEDRRSYLDLANSHTEDGSPRLTGIWRTNVYGFRNLGGDGDQYGAIIKDMSRINHSCRPNCSLNFNRATFSFEMRATKLITKNEEILYSYCHGMELPTAQRQAQLRPYGFACTCPSCVYPTSNDALRTSLLPRANDLQRRSKPFMKENESNDRRLALALLEENKALLRDLREEGMEGWTWYRDALVVQATLTTALGCWLTESPVEKLSWCTAAKKYIASLERLNFAIGG